MDTPILEMLKTVTLRDMMGPLIVAAVEVALILVLFNAFWALKDRWKRKRFERDRRKAR